MQSLGAATPQDLVRRCRGRSKAPVFSPIMLALLHRLFQFFLVVGKQSMNLAVRVVADSVNLRIKLLPEGCCTPLS